jgi:DNA-binding MarR family transcriptional regulator
MSQPPEEQQGRAPEGARSSTEALRALQSVYTENEALFHQSNDFVAQVYGQGELSLGKRGVLRLLLQSGPQTVPQMAQKKHVSRQYIQKIVNQLAQAGYVAFAENEARKRSSLVHLTDQGRTYLLGRLQREVQIVREMVIPFPPDKLEETAAMLRAIREWQLTELQRLMQTREPAPAEPEPDKPDRQVPPSEGA